MVEFLMNAGDQKNFLMRNRKMNTLTPLILGLRLYLPFSWKYQKFGGHPRDFGLYGNVQNTVYARILGDMLMARAG